MASTHTTKSMNKSLLLLAVLTVVICGCALPGPAKEPVKKTYLLQADEPSGQTRSAPSDTCATLRISSPGSSPGFITSRMAYTVEPQRLDYFAYHEWVDSPAKLLATMMESRLDRSGLFRVVVKDSPDIRTHYRLDSELQQLQQVFDTEGSRIVLTIKVSLIAVADRSLLSSQIFEYVEPASQENPEQGVAAANRAAQQFLIDLVVFLTESLDPTNCND